MKVPVDADVAAAVNPLPRDDEGLSADSVHREPTEGSWAAAAGDRCCGQGTGSEGEDDEREDATMLVEANLSTATEHEPFRVESCPLALMRVSNGTSSLLL